MLKKMLKEDKVIKDRSTMLEKIIREAYERRYENEKN